jgi:hypothetical protein
MDVTDRGRTESGPRADRVRRAPYGGVTARTALRKYVIGGGRSLSGTCTGNVRGCVVLFDTAVVLAAHGVRSDTTGCCTYDWGEIMYVATFSFR